VYIKTMSSLFVAALGFAFGTISANFPALLQFVVCAAAMLIMLNALGAEPQYVFCEDETLGNEA
jgi:hypothetical protein